MEAQQPLTYLKGVGPAVAQKFKKLRIDTVEDLIAHVPYRFEDYSKVMRVSQIRPGPVTIKVTFAHVSARYARTGLHMTEAMASDESGSVKIIWFNQPYRAQALKSGEEYFVSGEFGQNYRYFAITNPAVEPVSSFPLHTARLVPVYKLTKGLGVAQVRKTVKSALESYTPSETLPTWLLEREVLLSKQDALQEMHFPTDLDQLARAQKRLGFEEVFELSLASELNKQAHKATHSLEVPFDEKLVAGLVEKLPFKMTDDQRKVTWQIIQDMRKGQPMNRLLEGDVGSGKTIVAALAAINTLSAGFQIALMAPTEILASQHAQSLHELFQAVGYHEKILLLTGSMNLKAKESARKHIADGTAELVIGTHALFQDDVQFKKLGLIVVDEQHRFGVEQRKKLQGKATEMPHVLNMTATPIPRSLALTLYGEMDVSILAQMPAGRIPVKTELSIAENREKIYLNVTKQLASGRQAFVVCPQIEEDEAGRLSVIKIHNQLSKKWLKSYKVGLLHGKMKSAEKEEVMQAFASGQMDALVATTVVEVGVNVPNATIMVIEGADMFGLAQLHQLRGRVGRGDHAGTCYLVMSGNDQPSKRLQLLSRENNGFKLADYDLELRGPGAIYGTMQHGELDLRVAKLTDVKLITSARNAAREFIERGEKLLKYPQLAARVNRLRAITNLN